MQLEHDIHTVDGWAEVSRHAPNSHVASLRLHVYTYARGLGAGKRLVRDAQDLARALNIRRLEATPYVDNAESTGFFVKLPGWHHEGIRVKGGRRNGELADTHLFAWIDEGGRRNVPPLAARD